MSSKTHLDLCLQTFSGELLSFVHRVTDSVSSLKRTVEQRPQAGVQDFKECLEDLEQQVADFTDEVQQLVDCTSETISFEELIGHCSAVYHSNRAAALALEEHLAQYGYQTSSRAVQEPEHIDDLLTDDAGVCLDPETAVLSRAYGRQGSKQQQLVGSLSLPTSPLRTGLKAGSSILPSRLGKSQPCSPAGAARRHPALLDQHPYCSAATAGHGKAPGTAGRASQAALAESDAWKQLDQGPMTHRKQERSSLGSNTSSTPAGLLISPGVAALASKYATSSVGGSSAD
eukprot:gene3930-4184_t